MASTYIVMVRQGGGWTPMTPENTPALSPGFVERAERRHRLEELHRIRGQSWGGAPLPGAQKAVTS